jgi:hypothetical protein
MRFASTLCLLLLVAAPVWAEGALPAKHKFTKRLLNSEEYVDIQSATFDDHFCISVTGFASDGEHVSEISVFDASGREVSRVVKTVFAKGAKWAAGFCPSTIKDEDVPGEWWFTVTLDDALVASASIMVTYGEPKAAEALKPPATKEPPGYPRARRPTERK